jgi:MFS family permease
VIGLDTDTVAWMLTGLLLFSVPGPIIAGWLSDRYGRKLLIVAVYLGGTVSLAVMVAAGSNLVGLWAAVLLLSAFSFVESPQLQALLADISLPQIRDASFSIYFTLAFGVGSLWVACYGALISALGDSAGLVAVFGVMALANIAAALTVIPIRAEQRTAEVRAVEDAAGMARAGRPVESA